MTLFYIDYLNKDTYIIFSLGEYTSYSFCVRMTCSLTNRLILNDRNTLPNLKVHFNFSTKHKQHSISKQNKKIEKWKN